MVTHIYRSCILANLGLALSAITWWDLPPSQLWRAYGSNKLGLPMTVQLQFWISFTWFIPTYILCHTNGIQIRIAFTWLWNLNYPIKRPSGSYPKFKLEQHAWNSLIEFCLNNANWWPSNSIYPFHYIEDVQEKTQEKCTLNISTGAWPRNSNHKAFDRGLAVI
jgi:hypothetical protein